MIKTLLLNLLTFVLVDILLAGIQIDTVALISLTLVFTIMNKLIKPILKLLALPITILTFGLFSFVVNGIVLWLSFKLVPNVYFNNFFTLILASILFSVINTGLNEYEKKDKAD